MTTRILTKSSKNTPPSLPSSFPILLLAMFNLSPCFLPSAFPFTNNTHCVHQNSNQVPKFGLFDLERKKRKK